MPELTAKLWGRALGHTAIVWTICVLLAGMVLDGGYVFGYYIIASVLFWIGSFVYFGRRPDCRSLDLWIFRLGPFILLVLGLIGGELVHQFTHR